MDIHSPIPLLEEILGHWQAKLGADYIGYKHHVYRMAHCCLALRDCTDVERDKIFIAAAFHDLGIWTEETVDYLPPSILLARDYLSAAGLAEWSAEIEDMIDQHHKLRPVHQSVSALVEVFRRGDLVDFSLGVIRFGIPRRDIKALQQQFPNAGFHKRLMQLAGGWFRRHPLSPPPFIKW